jgi:hypothetical protein
MIGIYARVNERVKKIELLLEREQQRDGAARKYGLVAATSEERVTVAGEWKSLFKERLHAGGGMQLRLNDPRAQWKGACGVSS